MNGVHSVHAEEAVRKKIHHIKNRLEGVGVMLGKYESLQRFHYGHDGDLGYVPDLLNQAFIFMTESED